MPDLTPLEKELLLRIAGDEATLEIGRKAIEETLVEWRDNRMSAMRNNGLVIRERDGSDSAIIRMGPEDALRIGLTAIARAESRQEGERT